ncbi:MAG TPA: T9SS type A sorting domain-containing protein [Candidatus Limnocylindria bacterium]|nr:T9SS type A sorting domain-containing protein [Candidatus Limnocylindria bacterium]
MDYDTDGDLDVFLCGTFQNPNLYRRLMTLTDTVGVAFLNDFGDTVRSQVCLLGKVWKNSFTPMPPGMKCYPNLEPPGGVPAPELGIYFAKHSGPPPSRTGETYTLDAGSGNVAFFRTPYTSGHWGLSSFGAPVRIRVSGTAIWLIEHGAQPLAAPATGKRLVPEFGNVSTNRAWPLRGLADGTYFWSVQSIDAGFLGSPFAAEGSFTIGTAGVGDPAAALVPLRVTHPFPNPMQGHGALGFELAEAGPVSLEIFDTSGRHVAEVARGVRSVGANRITWEAQDLAPGLYFFRLSAAGAAITGRTIVLRP